MKNYHFLGMIVASLFAASNAQAAAAVTKVSCINVNVDQKVSVLEDGYGTAFDIDKNGEFGIDQDAVYTDLVITETTTFVKGVAVQTKSYRLDLGHHRIDSKNSTVTVDESNKTKFESAPVDYTFDDGLDVFRFRHFTASGLAMVFYQESGKGKLETLATLDCRKGVTAPKRP